MRLLERQPDGGLILREFIGRSVPAYAILSHTWGNEEVSFQEVGAGIGTSKAGWKKIDFCAKQADADGLRYIWVDTCCIDKRNAVELSEAINSMFRWYQKAARCYVYLSDVSIYGQYGQSNASWEADFRESRWFTRGWTLQELIAPTLVDFFSSEGRRLGTKITLERMIYERTGIATSALRGDTLSNFRIVERMAWAEKRNTTLEEDKSYCLLGIFDVSMPLIYGEGRVRASRRLQDEIHKFYKGPNFDQFAVRLNLSTVPEAAQFVGRGSVLTEMHKLLHGHDTRSSIVLHGLGGIGKTQLAIEYIKQHKEKYTAIFWLNATNENSLRLSFRAIAQQIVKHYSSNNIFGGVYLDGNIDEVVNAVKAWLDLRENTRWLMVYDNYDNPRSPNSFDRDPLAVDIHPYIAEADHGSIIITTRLANITEGRRLYIQKLLSIEEGLKILSNTSKRRSIKNDTDAIALVAKLDGLPLALSTAGAYLEHVSTSFSEYLRLYEESWLKLQKTSPLLNSYKDRSLYTTWQATFDRIQQRNPVSAQLLKFWAYFDSQDIWFELLRHARSADDKLIRELANDKLSFNKAVRLLCEYGLVSTEPAPGQLPEGYSVHPCVHSWTSFVLNRKWDKSLARLAITCVALEVPGTTLDESWIIGRRLLLHATRCEPFILDGRVDVKGIESNLHKLGNLYKDACKLSEAEEMYIRALQGKEERLGPNHISTVNTVTRLGGLYQNQGKLAKAEDMYIRALRGKEELFGPGHISTLDTANSLGKLYAQQNKLAMAEEMYIRALRGKMEALRPDHLSTLKTVRSLGDIYAKQGKLANAEVMYLRALHSYENDLGLEPASFHLPALDTMFAIADLFLQTGRKDMAMAMYNRALFGYRAVQGPLSERCRVIEDRLQALQFTLAVTESQYCLPRPERLGEILVDRGRSTGREYVLEF